MKALSRRRNNATMRLRRSSLHLFLSFLTAAFHVASSSHISYEVIEPHEPVGRSLLQQKTTCNVDFEHMNYTVITSQCRGPKYTPEHCCAPLEQLLCPIKDQVNDLRSNCAETFFSYINLYGKYPPGLFASMCRDREEGLSCKGNENQSAQQQTASADALHVASVTPGPFLFGLFVILLFSMFYI